MLILCINIEFLYNKINPKYETFVTVKYFQVI